MVYESRLKRFRNKLAISIRLSMPRMRDHIAFGIVAAAIVGFCDAGVAVALHRPWSFLVLPAPMLAAIIVAPIGVIIGLVAYAIERFVTKSRFLIWSCDLWRSDSNGIGWIVSLSGTVWILIAVSIFIFQVVLSRAMALQEKGFAVEVSIFALVANALVMAVLLFPLTDLLQRGLFPIVARYNRVTRDAVVIVYSIAIAIPIGVLLLVFIVNNRTLMGTITLLPYSILIGLAQGLLRLT